jgi:predicted chitinase
MQNAVFTTKDAIEAGFVKSILEANGIKCFIKNLYYSTLTLTGTGAAPIVITVSDEDREKAEEIVAQYYRDLRENNKD